MSISREQVDHIASLARLNLTDEEAELYREQLSDLLGFFDKLSELDTEDILPTSTILPVQTVLREDQPKQEVTQDALLQNAASESKKMFKVKAVLD